MASSEEVNLQLISGDFFVAQSTRVGCFGNQTADIVEQAADLAQGAISRCNDLVGALRVGESFVDAGDIAA